MDQNKNKLDPTQYGYVLTNGLLVPQRIEILLPPQNELVPSCTCKGCVRKTCPCVAANLECCSFCKCRIKETCKNKLNLKN